VILRKVRNKQAGRVGQTVLLYERFSGRYYDVVSQPGERVCPIVTPVLSDGDDEQEPLSDLL